MRYIYIIIIFCVFQFVCLSQAPGYMGKKFSFGYGFYASPIVFESNSKGESLLGAKSDYSGGPENAETGKLVFNKQHEGFLEYVVGRRLSIGISARFYKTTSANYSQVEVIEPSYTPYTNYSYSFINNPKGIYHIKGINYSIYAKKYRKIYAAPWGRYGMFGINIKRYTCTYDSTNMYVTNPSYNYYGSSYENSYNNFGPLVQKYTKFDIMVGWGRTRIFYDIITLDYGVNVNVIALITTPLNIPNGDLNFLLKDNTTADYIEKTSTIRVRGVNRINAFCKIGFLLF